MPPPESDAGEAPANAGEGGGGALVPQFRAEGCGRVAARVRAVACRATALEGGAGGLRRAQRATGCLHRLWRPGFCGNDDGGSDVADAAIVAVVSSSLACPQYCLGLFVAVELKLRWQGPVVYDDWLQVARSAIFRGASRAWFCSSEFSVRVGAALSGRRSTCRRLGWALPCVFQSMEWAWSLLFLFLPGFP